MQVHDTKPGPLRNSRQASAYCKVNLSSHPTAEPGGLELNSGGVWRGKWLMESAGDAKKSLLLCSFHNKKDDWECAFFLPHKLQSEEKFGILRFCICWSRMLHIRNTLPSFFPLPRPPLPLRLLAVPDLLRFALGVQREFQDSSATAFCIIADLE